MKITQHKTDGVRIDFKNGLVLSTIWGYCTYSDNHDIKTSEDYGFGRNENGSSTVEFMFIDGDEKLIEKLCKKYGDGENPSAYIPVHKWIEMIAYINKLQNIK